MKLIDLTKLQSLEELIYKTVKVTTINGKVFEGEISSYTHADDSDDGLETIGMDMGDYIEAFDITILKSIEEFELSDLFQVVKLYNEKQPVNKIAEEVGKSIAVIKLLLSNCGFSLEEYA